jgi:hypothetical protein
MRDVARKTTYGTVYRAKLGTMPAFLQFRHAYKFRPGLRVIYREFHHGGGRYGHGNWSPGEITRTEPVLFVTRT